MTHRLYYEDAYTTRFSARVVERLDRDGEPALVLDRSAFYPTSGGQPADRGTLCGKAVVDVIVREQDDAVVHALASGCPAGVGDEIGGVVDWPRRFDHMQQHTGQHVLSAALERVLGAETVGFHLGSEVSTVDVDVAPLDLEAASSVERLANRVVWEDRPVETRLVDREELAALPLRRPPTVEGPIRLVEIAGSRTEPDRPFDVNPCGGTHVARTGEIGSIKIVGLERRGDETRIEFLCGGRALGDHQEKHAIVDALSRLLTVGHRELDEAVRRLQDDAKQLRREARRARERLLRREAAQLAEGAVVHGPYRVVQRVWAQRPPDELRALAQELAFRFERVALLASRNGRVHLCFACPEDLGLDVASLLRQACAELGGKGGGQPHLAQGSAPETEVSRVESTLTELSSALGAGS